MFNSISLDNKKIKNMQKLVDVSMCKDFKNKRFTGDAVISILDPNHEEYSEKKI